MEYLIIIIVAIFASGLTLFSGFGLGTILLPAFALFFPVEVAIAITAIVHFLNNIFKLFLLGKHADKKIVIRFGFPAILSAFLGAYALIMLSDLAPLISYQMMDKTFIITPVKLVIAIMMTLFAIIELLPADVFSFNQKYLPVGGLLSGFFGGLSGHQGALRSAFLLRCNLSKEAFIATGIVIACIIDFSRLFVYSSKYFLTLDQGNITLLLAATLAAFLGAYLGNKLLKKITMQFVRITVSIMLFLIALGLGLGII
jgi:uncharacterized protein